jgi:hypothetical protein
MEAPASSGGDAPNASAFFLAQCPLLALPGIAGKAAVMAGIGNGKRTFCNPRQSAAPRGPDRSARCPIAFLSRCSAAR